MSISNMKIGSRLWLGFGAVLLLMAIIIAISISNLMSLEKNINSTVTDKFPKVVLANDMINSLNVIARAVRNVLLTKDKQTIQKEMDRIPEQRKIIEEKIKTLGGMVRSEEGKVLYKAIVDAHTPYLKVQDKFLALVNEGKRDEAVEMMLTDLRKAQNSLMDTVNKLIEHQTKSMEEVGKQGGEIAVRAVYEIVILGVIAFVCGIAVGMVIIRNLMKQLGGEPSYAADAVNRIAAGDLTLDLIIKHGDNSSLLYSLKSMQAALGNLIHEIKASTDTISTASREIASGNSDLSQRTEEQASSLEETASSMEELTSTVKQNTENAKQANQLAISASDVAGKGGEVVSKVVVTMDSINESSRKIVEIISVIDGIAFQTNILALNAAVEAARAGEQGRGFAVVAGEVRNLAQRSAAAAKEIKTLIGDSVEKVEGGSKLVAQAGQTMEEIVTSIRRVTDIMSEITAASVEQSQGIEQVNTAITQMDEVTQQNAALVEEAAAAAESLEEQAQILAASVATFKVDNSESLAVATHVPAATATRHTPAAPARKAIAAPKTGTGKSTAVAKPTSKSGEDSEWQEF